MLPLKKSIFITGGTSGIGAEVAKRYLEEGHRVGVLGRSRDKFLMHFKDTDVLYYPVDVTHAKEVKEAIEDFSKEGLDIVIASHGVAFSSKSSIPNFDYSRSMIEINLIGVINVFEPAFHIMKEKRQGQLVAISSIAGFNGLPGASAYSASKSAVIKLCESYALDFKKWNIFVTCICPGFVDTPLTKVNPHPMPFLMSAKEASLHILKAIEKRKIIYSFPWLFSRLVLSLSWIPRPIYAKILGIKKFNYSVQNQKER